MKRPLIIISNDDGYAAKGIRELVRMIHDLGDIIVCAPEGPRSGQSRAFTMTDITVRDVTEEFIQADSLTFSLFNSLTSAAPRLTVYACSGTPVDCVKMACGILADRTPDLILGGINHGDNASTNVHYSGTAGIAFEGAIKGIPSIAFSLCDYDLDADFTPMEKTVRTYCQKVLRDGLPYQTFLNVNVPKVASAAELKGTRICRMASGKWLNEVEKAEGRTDANGLQIYQLKGYYHDLEPDATDTDAWAIRNGYIAVTPTTVDVTSRTALQRIKELLTD